MRDRPPPAAADLVELALGRALAELAATGGPLLPTSMHRDADGDRLVRYQGADLPTAVATARETLVDADLDTWVLVWDGYLTADGVRTESLYAHLEVVGEPHAHLYAWRYHRLVDGTVEAPERRIYLGRDGRFDSPDRSHPLVTPQEPAQTTPWRRWSRRRRPGR